MKRIEGIVDRFEDEIVVIEINGSTKDYQKSMFPEDLEVGDIVVFEGESVKVDKTKTNELRKEIEDLMDELFE